MADLIDFDKILKRLKEVNAKQDPYELQYRKSAQEMNDLELKELVDDIDEIITCLVEEVEGVKKKLNEMEKLNTVYVDIMRKLVEVIVMSRTQDGETVLTEIRSWINNEGSSLGGKGSSM